MKVEFLVSIKHPDDAEPMFMTREQAKQVYDALHAEFGDFGQARELSQLACESVARELRLAELEMDVMALRGDYYLEKPAATGPSLQDDIERMIADHIVDANEKVDDADEQESEFLSRFPRADIEPGEAEILVQAQPIKCPSNTPAPSNDQQVKMGKPFVSDLWRKYRARYPHDTHAKTVTRITWAYPNPRPTTATIRELLRIQGIEVSEPPLRGACAAMARAAKARDCRLRKPPEGYKIVNAEVWRASESLLSDADIREMAEGGLARAGLALETEAVGW